jgi:hypothetical protein
MNAVNNKVERYHYIVFTLWLIFIVITAKYFIYDSLVAFDPKKKLAQDSSVIVNQIKFNLGLDPKAATKTIIHFTSQDCACTSYSTSHKSTINQKAVETGFTIKNIELSENNNNLIPSTPAVLVLDETGGLIYLGPYAEGIECSVNSSVVDIVIQNYLKGFNANLIVNDTKGCYCNL